MCPTRYCNKSVVRFLALSRPRSGSETSSSTSSTSSSTNSTPSPCPPSLPQDVQNRVAVEEVGRVHIGHLVQLGVADFSEKWALLFTEAPKELPDRNISLVVVNMATMAIRHIIKAYEPRIA